MTMSDKAIQRYKCFAGIHEYEDKGNQYFEILVCKHCGYKGKSRAKMTTENKK